MVAASFPDLRHLSVILCSLNFECVDAIDYEPYESTLSQPILIHVRYFNCHQSLRSTRDPLKENLPQITGFFKSIWPNLSYLGIDDGECLHDNRKFI
ncbi:hypothetical protein OPQ81_010965 [Rhizoctonia solani]|nr:hypothetical protein OPQ81_010965 [Rhizoctonia solani]